MSQQRWISERPEKGVRCRRRNEAGEYCNRSIDPEHRAKGWQWDADCVKEVHAQKRAEAKASAPAKPKKAAIKKAAPKQSASPERPKAPRPPQEAIRRVPFAEPQQPMVALVTQQ